MPSSPRIGPAIARGFEPSLGSTKHEVPGQLVLEKRIDAGGPPDEIRDLKVDLANAFEHGNQLISSCPRRQGQIPEALSNLLWLGAAQPAGSQPDGRWQADGSLDQPPGRW